MENRKHINKNRCKNIDLHSLIIKKLSKKFAVVQRSKTQNPFLSSLSPSKFLEALFFDEPIVYRDILNGVEKWYLYTQIFQFS